MSILKWIETQTRRRNITAANLLLVILMTACSLSDLVHVPPSSGEGTEVDSKIVTSYTGALGLMVAAQRDAATVATFYRYHTSFFTDELLTRQGNPFEIRGTQLGESSIGQRLFVVLSSQRLSAQQAIGALRRHSEASPRTIGELYALQGMAEVLLAELFCSGIPLGTVPFQGGFEYSGALSTEEVVRHAQTLFDSALVYGSDSVSVSTLARIGAARASLILGEFSAAANAVAGVATSDSYTLSPPDSLLEGLRVRTEPLEVTYEVKNAKGRNGMHWIASSTVGQDPRVPLATTMTPQGEQFLFPVQQTKLTNLTRTIVYADGIEARLIEAEAALQPASNPRGPWLETLNALRRGIGLNDTTDPGTEAGRVNLLFRERAYWLYMTGHRQGDLRRLVQRYGRTVGMTYPSGPYEIQGLGLPLLYGSAFTMSPPPDEQLRNPLYHGCFSQEL